MTRKHTSATVAHPGNTYDDDTFRCTGSDFIASTKVRLSAIGKTSQTPVMPQKWGRVSTKGTIAANPLVIDKTKAARELSAALRKAVIITFSPAAAKPAK